MLTMLGEESKFCCFVHCAHFCSGLSPFSDAAMLKLISLSETCADTDPRDITRLAATAAAASGDNSLLDSRPLLELELCLPRCLLLGEVDFLLDIRLLKRPWPYCCAVSSGECFANMCGCNVLTEQIGEMVLKVVSVRVDGVSNDCTVRIVDGV